MNHQTERDIPRFEAPYWLRSGHSQTIIGSLGFGPGVGLPSTYHEIHLDDGDRLTAFESLPKGWKSRDPSVLMVHGLGGSVRSPYLKRIARKLWQRGVRVVRMNLRGAGAGFGLARGIYHAGRTEDLRAVSDWMTKREPNSVLGLIGFSLGANLVLKLAYEASTSVLVGLDSVVAVNPPIDLKGCSTWIQRRENRVYDRNFVRLLTAEINRLHQKFPELGETNLAGVSSLYEFDDRYTARRNYFESANDYYSASSADSMISGILVDGLVLHSVDDPFIPPEPFLKTPFPANLALEMQSGGGHLGYLSRRPWNGTRRWLDQRVTTWFAERWKLRPNER